MYIFTHQSSPANLGTQEGPIEFDTWSGSNPVLLVADRE